MTNKWGFGVGLFLLGLIIYWPSLSGGFILDDFDLLEHFSGVGHSEPDALLRTGRPLLMLSYVLNHRLSGLDPFGFHLTNILLHCLNALLLWRLVSALFSNGRLDDVVSRQFQTVLIHAIPLLFLTSPIQTESVAYISSRSEVLAATFYIAALWVFASGLREKRPWVTAFLVLFFLICSLSCKQDKLTLPFAILLMDYLLLSGRNWRRMKQNWPTYAIFLGGTIAGFWVVVKPILFAPSAGFNLPWQEYLFTQFRMWFLYLRLLFAPFGLNGDYDIAPSGTIWEHLSWLALIGLILMAAATLYYRRRAPMVTFGALFFFVALAPTTSFLPLLDFAAERRLYLPSIGFFLAALAPVLWIFARSSRSAYVGLAAVLAIYAVGTFQRSRVWSDDLVFWHDTAEKSPRKRRPLSWLGKLYSDRSVHDRALHYWEQAEKLVEPGSRAHGFLLMNLGVSAANVSDSARAVEYYRKAAAILPRQSILWANLAVAQLRLGREEEGWQSFEQAIKMNRRVPEVYLLRGQELYRRGRYAQAADDYKFLLLLRPKDALAARNLQLAEARLRGQRPRKAGKEQNTPSP